MSKNQRATFTKTEFENGGKPKTVYSFSLEKAHWVFGILASIAAVAVCLVVLRGAVYASVQDVAGHEFNSQLERFHSEAKPAIRRLIDERIATAQSVQAMTNGKLVHAAELTRAAELAGIAETLGRLDERLESIERRFNRMEANP